MSSQPASISAYVDATFNPSVAGNEATFRVFLKNAFNNHYIFIQTVALVVFSVLQADAMGLRLAASMVKAWDEILFLSFLIVGPWPMMWKQGTYLTIDIGRLGPYLWISSTLLLAPTLSGFHTFLGPKISLLIFLPKRHIFAAKHLDVISGKPLKLVLLLWKTPLCILFGMLNK